MFGKLIKSYLSISLILRIFVAFIIGSAIGIALWFISARTGRPLIEELLPVISPFGLVLINMLKMIVIPVIFLSLITGAASLPLKRFGRIGAKVMGWYFLTSLMAALVGVVIALIANPGGGADLQGWERLAAMQEQTQAAQDITVTKSLSDLLVNMFMNPFKALAAGNFLPIIVFAIMFGLALRVSLDRDASNTSFQNLLDLIAAARDAIFTLVDWILEYVPIGVLALSIMNFGLYGPEIVGPYVKVAIGIIVGILCMLFLVYMGLVAVILRENPYKVLKRLQEPMITAFMTRSSAATLPVSLRTADEELNIRNELSSFSLPLGATINMDGVCVHLPMFAVLAANLFNMHMTPVSLIILVMTTVLASIGAGGVPGGSLMLLFIILEAMGLGATQVSVIVAIALGINPILDMFETANNVTGDLIATFVVAKNEKMLESESL
ncbi:cation:dicarboxylase symporter family transporter [candidate division KSB1 bacterium]|nr:cation:dicarboxylase symporter family transporter [candidate division KSB1 bacterium]